MENLCFYWVMPTWDVMAYQHRPWDHLRVLYLKPLWWCLSVCPSSHFEAKRFSVCSIHRESVFHLRLWASSHFYNSGLGAQAEELRRQLPTGRSVYSICRWCKNLSLHSFRSSVCMDTSALPKTFRELFTTASTMNGGDFWKCETIMKT